MMYWKENQAEKKGRIDHKTNKKKTVAIISEECGDSPKQAQRIRKKIGR